MLFRLIGNQTLFRAVKRYDAAGFIPSVIGVSLDGKKQTAARVEDVELVPDVERSAGPRPEHED